MSILTDKLNELANNYAALHHYRGKTYTFETLPLKAAVTFVKQELDALVEADKKI